MARKKVQSPVENPLNLSWKENCRFCNKSISNIEKFNHCCSEECENKFKRILEYRKANELCIHCGEPAIKKENDIFLCEFCGSKFDPRVEEKKEEKIKKTKPNKKKIAKKVTKKGIKKKN